MLRTSRMLRSKKGKKWPARQARALQSFEKIASSPAKVLIWTVVFAAIPFLGRLAMGLSINLMFPLHASEYSVDVKDLPVDLYVPDGARMVGGSALPGTEGLGGFYAVDYFIDEQYPCSKFLSLIDKHLTDLGWSRTRKSPACPTMSLLPDGWTEDEDGLPDRKFRRHWINDANELLALFMRYPAVGWMDNTPVTDVGFYLRSSPLASPYEIRPEFKERAISAPNDVNRAYPGR